MDSRTNNLDVTVWTDKLTTWLTVISCGKSIIYNRCRSSSPASSRSLLHFICILLSRNRVLNPSHDSLTVFTVLEQQESGKKEKNKSQTRGHVLCVCVTFQHISLSPCRVFCQWFPFPVSPASTSALKSPRRYNRKKKNAGALRKGEKKKKCEQLL